jgi:hypothetical protein
LFDNVSFEKEVTFNSCELGLFSLAYINKSSKKFEIKQSIFKNEADFSSCFYMNAFFNRVTFEKYANFHGTKFELFVLFLNCLFKKDADFMFSIFKDNVIIESIFLDGASFENAQFGKDIGIEYLYKTNNKSSAFNNVNNFCFDRSVFHEETTFFRAKFFGNAIFNRAKFYDLCNFLGARFVGNVGFHAAEFKSFAKFGAGSKIFGNADFSEAVFHEGAYFHDLEFGKKLKLARARIENLMIRWDAIKDHLEDNWKFNEDVIRLEEVFDKSIIPLYLALIKNFNNLGFHDDADGCYLMLREKKKKNIKDKKSRIMDCLDYALFGYGIQWKNPLACGLLIMVFFLSLFFALDNNFLINNSKALYNATFNSLASFISSSNSNNNFIINISYIERFLGYIIMSCFLVTLAKKRLR